AVVTGASKGIGAAIAEYLAAAGAAVVINYARSKTGADAVVNRIRQADGKAVAVQADVSKPEDIPRLLPETKKAIRRDIPDAVVRFFDTGHCALETHAAEIAAAIREFLPR